MNSNITQEKLIEMSKEIDRLIALDNLLDPNDDTERKLMLINVKKMDDYREFLRKNFLTYKNLKLVS